ncbi:hypothetical protein QOZ83_01805 [Romboutsia sedimentorum]|uniref:hypothetical protein n=1 Tax=Romboutsia sedimentorum TaxID=1368474 RepID=UPI0024DE05FB|nr:hypothetical protein [Romboutsia sedimentorum]MDK2584580.1 hypothetical protein [Romboutsia sedimentorum]
MKTLKKLIVIGVVGVVLFIYPKSFKQTYKDVQVYENGNKVSTIDIELDGKIHKSYFVWQRLMFSEVLKGTATIGEEEYNLQPWDLYMFPDEDGNYTDKGIYRCSLDSDKHDVLDDENSTLNITHDKSKIYITLGNKEFIYPSNTVEDYQNVKDIMDR